MQLFSVQGIDFIFFYRDLCFFYQVDSKNYLLFFIILEMQQYFHFILFIYSQESTWAKRNKRNIVMKALVLALHFLTFCFYSFESR